TSVADSDPEEDEDDHADYPADGGEDDDDESSDDDDDDDDVEEDEEEEEHLAHVDSTIVASLAVDHIPSPPTSPTYAQALLGCRVAMIRATPSPIPLPSPFIPSPIRPPHTKVSMAQMRATTQPTYHSLLPVRTPLLLPIPLPAPSTSHRADILEADVSPQKRLLHTAPTPRYEVEESSAVGTARRSGSTVARRVDCSFVNTIETSVQDVECRAMTAIEVVNLRVSYQAQVRRRESEDFYLQHQDA
nr:hypothetical protein [Tanacetum cinerariifolium]